jgi:hypothetical protein
MKDERQHPRAAEPRPTKRGSGQADPELLGLVQSFFEATRAAKEEAAAGDFSKLNGRLRERESILDRLRGVNSQQKEPGSDPDGEKLQKIMESIRQENIRILQQIQQQRKSVLKKIVEVQNRRHVFNYLR